MESDKQERGVAVRNRIYMEITNRCNLACDFCHGTKRPLGAMTPENFRRIAEKLRGQTNYLYFHVLGEPLLHPQLGELLDIAGRLGFRVCLVTNGTLLQKRWEELLAAESLHKISVSLHSFEGNGGAGDLQAYLQQVWDSCVPLAERGVLCALRLWNEGAEQRYNGEVEAFFSRMTGQDAEKLPRDARGNRTLLPNLFLERAKRFDWPDLQAPESGADFCHGLTRQLAVLWDGTVTPCCLDSEGTIALGNLFEQTLEEILQGERAAAMAAGFAARKPTEELCRRCGYARRFRK